MKKNSIYLAVMLIIVFVSCKKQSNSSTSNSNSQGYGGYGMTRTTGMFDITLSKNVDTTITMPISAHAVIYGTWRPDITIHFDSLPSIVTSVIPSSYSGYASSSTAYISKDFAFHIHAIDSGAFKVVVLATSSYGNPSQAADSFHVFVQ